MAKTLFQKIWQDHVVSSIDDETDLIYIDRHLVHEVTSPQAFEGLRLAERKVRRPDLTIATMDHNVPTVDRMNIKDPISKAQIEALEKNCKEFGVKLYGLDSEHQGIVHVIGPELGLTLPNMTIVCGDSHTSTHGAFGALAFGIGTSEVEHVLATQCLQMKRPKTFLVKFNGVLQKGVTSKDMILYLTGLIGTAGGTGYVFEFAGTAIESLSMEARMSLCNMSIEAGARAGLVAPDQTTFDYLKHPDRIHAPKDIDAWIEKWKAFKTDNGAKFDRVVEIDASQIEPQVTWGTSPGMVTGITHGVPSSDTVATVAQNDVEKAFQYMGVSAGQKFEDMKVDVVFLGSCTNSRIEDLRSAAEILKNKKISDHVQMLVVPGSQHVKKMAEAEGLDQIFKNAGAEWRESGCSMCLAMNPDKLESGQRCASTSNRNFEGRQGSGGRTHLVSPIMAAAAALHGHFVDVRELL